MARERQQKEIGGLTFDVMPLPYWASQRLLARVLRLLGPGLARLGGLVGSGSVKTTLAAFGNLDTSALLDALGGVCAQLDPDDAEALTRALLETARVQQEHRQTHEMVWVPVLPVIDVVIPDVWTGLQLQAFALWVHFGNFSGALAAVGAGAAASPSPESTISTGSKG